MQYTAHYESPLGGLLLAADDVGLTGLWFDGEKYYALHLAREHEMRQTAVHEQTAAWLDVYFSGREPDFMPPLHLIGTPFQQEVWALLRQIPYGKTTTYGALAKTLAAQRGLERMSAQAVGGAVGHIGEKRSAHQADAGGIHHYENVYGKSGKGPVPGRDSGYGLGTRLFR